jgi:hypothetical protein
MFNFDNKQAQLDFEYNSDKIDTLLAEMSINDASAKSSKN